MKIFLNFFKFFSILSMSLIFVISAAYFFLVSKPENIVNIANKILKEEFLIQYKNIDSDLRVFSPKIIINDLLILDDQKQGILKLDEITIAIKLIESILNNYIFLDLLSLKKIEFLTNTKFENSSASLKFKIKDLFIETDKFLFSSNSAHVLSLNGNQSFYIKDGFINNIPYSEISIFKESDSNHYFYLASLKLDENLIEKEEFVDLNQFSFKKINLDFFTKGYFDFVQQKFFSIEKYLITDSKLITDSRLELSNINAMLFTSLNKELNGIFSLKTLDQKINGVLKSNNEEISLNTDIFLEMGDIFSYGEYLSLNGLENFNTILTIGDRVSLELNSNLENTSIKSIVSEINKDKNETLETKIYIDNLTNPSYFIKNLKFETFLNSEGNGYFSFGQSFKNDIESIDINDGFFVFLELDKFNALSLLNQNQSEYDSNLKLIKLKINELNLLNNIYIDQNFEINFNENESKASFNGNNLNGTFRMDSTGFARIDVFDTKFEFKGINSFESNESFDFKNINLRFVGRNIQTFDNVFQNVDFYFLRNNSVSTIDDIKISSVNLNVEPSNQNDKAYISYNSKSDLYKIRGSYELINEKNLFDNLINYDFDYLYSDLNIQWIGTDQLKNLEGRVKFKIKDLESNRSLPDSALLNTLKIFNLNALISNLNNEANFNSSKLTITRAEGDIYIGKNRALLDIPIKLETAEAKMIWKGEILKNDKGLLDQLDLSLDMRLKVSENIPWYAAIFGGIPALAGGFVIENIIDERLDNASTFKFNVIGSINEPEILRLD